MAAPTSGQAAARQNGTARGGSGRRRKVATAAGAARYHKPIGSEIGGPRDANHAAIQQDQGARKNYGDLVGGDPAKQRQALDGMSTEDLNKLADIAFSFKSADPKVVQLRIAARNAQARRGIRVPVGQTQTYLPGKKAPAPAPSNRGGAKMLSRGVGPASQRLIELAASTQKADQHESKFGNFPIQDVAALRKAISAIGRAKPEQRPAVARHIILRAGQLNASHLISDAIRNYAKGNTAPMNMSRGRSGAVELAGRWKHGYIPLDAEAMASKMKGRTGGKKWWGDGTHGGVSGNLKPHGSPKSGSPGRNIGSESNPAARHKMMEQGRQARIRRGVATPEDHATERAAQQLNAITGKPSPPAHGGSGKLTSVVKSGSPKAEPRGAAVNDTYTRGHAGAKDGFDRGHRVSYTLNGKKYTGTITRIENGSGATVRRNRGGGAHDLVDRKDLTHVDTPKSRTIPDKPRVGTTSATDVNKVSSGTPADLADKYLQMHGAAGVRTKIRALDARKSLSAKDKAMLAALRNVQLGGKSVTPASPAGVRKAYGELTGGKHRKYVQLSDLRPKLGGTREQQDATLQQMARSAEADLAPHSGQKRHQPDQQAAAWRGKHLIALEPPN